MSYIDTLYGRVDTEIFNLCEQLTLVVLDVDGVLSDGYIYLGNNGEELKSFNTKDGFGIKALTKIGIDVAVITGRQSKIVEDRMNSLQVKHIIQGTEEKRTALKSLMDEHGYAASTTASIGDDVPDLGMFDLSAIKVAVADAHPMLKDAANFVTSQPGGRGAVREFCDLVLLAKDALYSTNGASC